MSKTLGRYQKNFDSNHPNTPDKSKGITRGKSAGPSARRKVNLRVSGTNNRKQ